MRILITLALVSLTALTAMAQPTKWGCHYLRNQGPKRGPMTAGQLKALNASIARSDTFDILHYDIAIDVTNYTLQRIKAATTVRFTPKLANQTFIRFDLYQLTVDSVTDANGPLPFSYDTEFLRVDLPTVPALGDTLEVTVHYNGQPHRDPTWGGFYFESGYIYNLGIGLTTIPPNFGKVWYPCFDSFVERATYTYRVKSAGGYKAWCQGDFQGEIQLGGDTVIRTFEMAPSIPTHVSAIAVSDYQSTDYVHTGAYGNVPIRLTAKPAQLAAMTAKFADLGGAIDALEFWYGPHAWGRVGYVLTTDGALEIPTNIAYPQFMTGQPLQDNQDLYSHELGHHWWGDVVTPFNHNDMWLKEGPAEYSGHLVEEWVEGNAAFVEIVKDNHQYVLEQAHIQDEGFRALSGIADEQIYGVHTYYKGASVLHNLRGYLGDSLFRQAMTAIQVNNAFSTLDAAGFRDAIEATTGKDMDAFFDAWVFAPGFSVFTVQSMTSNADGSGWDVELIVRQLLRAAPAYHLDVPVDITLISANNERYDTLMTVSNSLSLLQLECPFQPVMAVLNGANRLNQARMDHERFLYPGQNLTGTLPHVDFRVYTDNVPDTALIRVEHIWAGPYQTQLGWGVDEVSSTHYWTVDGLWPADTRLRGRIYYYGNDTNDLDNDLVGVNENDLILAYRATPLDLWEPYFDATPMKGNLTNGSGYVQIDTLRQGEYAFANGAANVGVGGVGDGAANDLWLYPVPASDRLSVRGRVTGTQRLWFDVMALDGRLICSIPATVQGTYTQDLGLEGMRNGLYLLHVRGADGARLGTARFEVMR
jgi:aminopeptidase N